MILIAGVLVFEGNRGAAVAADLNPAQILTTTNQTPISGRTLGGAVNGSPSAACSCRYKGKDVKFGQSVCMKTNNGMVEARCTRYLNNTSWTITRNPCPVS